MLFVLLFHIPLSRHDPFFGLRRCGNVGVDMFLFLSGVGLWFSWVKQREALAVGMKDALRHFFKNRYRRVYPAWLIIACLHYIPCYLEGRGYSRNVPDLIANIAFNWSFWRVDDLTFWYVPAAMMLYCFAPFYMELIRRHPAYRWLPVMMLVWCVMVQWIRPIHGAVGHLEIFWSRVPIFFIGINIGQWVKQRHIIDGAVPADHRALGVYTAHRQWYPAAQRAVLPCARMAEPRPALCGDGQPGVLSHSCAVCDVQAHSPQTRLLAYGSANVFHQSAPGLAVVQTHLGHVEETLMSQWSSAGSKLQLICCLKCGC